MHHSSPDLDPLLLVHRMALRYRLGVVEVQREVTVIVGVQHHLLDASEGARVGGGEGVIALCVTAE